MRLSDSRIIALSKTIERIRRTVGLSEKDFADSIGVTAKQYSITVGRDPGALLVMKVAAVYRVSLDNLVAGKIDFKHLAATRQHGPTVLPECYTVGAFSRMRTSLGILDYVEERIGWEFRDSVLRGFQLSEAALTSPEGFINIRLVSDICERLARSQSERFFYEAGLSCIHLPSNALLGTMLKRAGMTEFNSDSLRFVAELFDRNYRYTLEHLDPESMVLISTPAGAVCDSLKIHAPGNRYTCLYRAGQIGVLPALFGFTPTGCRETACIHRGDPFCRFEIGLRPTAKAPAKPGLRLVA